MNLGDIQFNKKDVKVNNYVRKGKLVKSYKKKIDVKSALLGAGGGVLGAGLLGSAFLLGKGRGAKQTTAMLGNMKSEILNTVKQQNNNVDDIVNKVISKIPKQEVNTKQIADEVLSRIPKQQQVQQLDSAAIIKAVEDKITKATPQIDIKSIADDVITRLPKQQSNVVDSDSIIRAVEDRVARSNKQLLSDIDDKLNKVKIEQPKSTVTKIESNITPEEVSSNNVKRLVKQSGKKDSFSNVLNPNRELNVDKLNKSFNKLNDEQLDKSLSSIVTKWNDIDEALKLPKMSKVKKDVLTKLSKRYEEVWTIGRKVKDARINTKFDDFDDFGGDYIDPAVEQAKKKLEMVKQGNDMYLKSVGVTPDVEEKIRNAEYGIPLSVLKKLRKKWNRPDISPTGKKLGDWQQHLYNIKNLLEEKGIYVKSKPQEIRNYDLDDFSYATTSIINFRSPICLGDVTYL